MALSFVRVARLALFVGLLGPAVARAYDVEVSSDTTFRAYEVQSSAARVAWTRRRLIQRLSLDLVQPVPREGHDRPWARLRTFVDLRFDQDFGDVCLVRDRDRCFVLTDAGVRAAYEPLIARRALSLPAVYVEADQLPFGTLVRAGRQTLWDPIGLARTDGVLARVTPVAWASVQASYGLLVRQASFGGRDSYVPDGVPRVDLDADERARTEVQGPAPARMLSLAGHFGDVRWARVGLYYRNVRDRTGLIQREAAVGLTSALAAPLRLDTHGVFDARNGDLVDGQAETSLRLPAADLRLRLRRQVPRFDYGSIWAFFVTAPQWQASLGADADLGSRVQVGGDLRARRMDADRARREWDAGMQARLGWSTARLRLQLSGFGWGGDLGATWGARGLVDYSLRHFLDVFGELSAFRIEGISAGLDPATSVGIAGGVSLRIASQARGNLELSHAWSATVGHRVALLAHLQIGAWR